MNHQRNLILILLGLVLAMGCTSEENPVGSKNNKPELVIEGEGLGFGGSVFVFEEGKSYPFAVRATDADNHRIYVTARVLNNTGTVSIGEPMDNIYPGSFRPNATGEHTVRITVSDRIDSVSANLTARFGRLTAVARLTPSNQLFNLQELTLDGQQSQSPHGAITSYTWLLRNSSGVVEKLVPTETGATPANPFRWNVLAPVGQYSIGLVVADVETQSDTAWAAFTIKNSQPVGGFQVETNFEQILEKVIVTTYEADDPDPGDSLSLVVAWRLDGQTLSDFNGLRMPTIPAKGGRRQLTQVVTDQHGGVGEFTRDVDVRGMPEAHFVFPNNETSFSIINDTTFAIDGTASIAGHLSTGIEEYIWYQRPLNGQAQEISRGNILNTLSFEVMHTVGLHDIGLKIKNREGLETLILWQRLEVVNSPPTAYFELDVDCSISGQCAFNVTLNGSKDRDPFDVLTYDWYRNCELTNQHDATPGFSSTQQNPITSIMLIAKDPHGASARFVSGQACP